MDITEESISAYYQEHQEEYKKGYNLINNTLASPLVSNPNIQKQRLNVWQQIQQSASKPPY